ncbi:hypothetical protein [Corallococcus macrosporus]|uniref:Uncharacterized protein n=1 Tax=Corallococcus macrosporus DSM 14697 TaxID=1189310 RepID=A0A250K2Y6_9BACT|nr:hypothetical protein [Corallococcus macrosporus]ATB50373.1 hypothetical protein MYMAC_006028 [Corallococcus macrosporus DSM 14697]
MLWIDEWTAWSARLTAVFDAAQLLLSLQPDGAAERRWAESHVITPELLKLYSLLLDFHERFASQLPAGAADALKRLFKEDGVRFEIQAHSHGMTLTLLLATVRAQVDYYLTDKQARARRAVERAFVHLQRSIVADGDFRKKWYEAFTVESRRSEDACEKLGAVHLLLHGIWAFKAEAAGGKTDLILGEQVREDDAVRSADAMVLTEWKVVRRGDDSAKKAMEAFVQAERYTHGTLAGFELSSHRYLVLVSEDCLPVMPVVPSVQGLNYEVRNIAVAPSSPSVLARAVVNAQPK